MAKKQQYERKTVWVDNNMTKKYIYDGIGIVQAVGIEIEQLINVKCKCGNEFSICREEHSDPDGYIILCPVCKRRWEPPNQAINADLTTAPASEGSEPAK